MNLEALEQAVGDIREEYILEALTLDRQAAASPPAKKPIRKLWKMLLIAAALAAALAVTAFAVYQYTIADLAIRLPDADGGSDYYTSTSDLSGSTEQYYTVAGYDTESPECQAQREWLSYCLFEKREYDARQRLSYSDPYYRVYGLAYQNDADKLSEIAEKYGLSPAQAVIHLTHSVDDEPGCTIGDLYEVMDTGPFILDGFDLVTSAIYDEGSFSVTGKLTLSEGGQTVYLSLYCAMNGTMPVFNDISSQTVDAFSYESLEAASGVVMDLALGTERSLIFVTMENSHVLIQTRSGTDSGLDMDGLKAVAECFDYAAMDSFDAARRAENISALFAGLAENADTDPAEEAIVVYGELGDWRITDLPDGYYYSSDVTTLDDSQGSLWGAENEDCSYISVQVFYRSGANAADAAGEILFQYGRCWADTEQGILNNRLGFDPEYIFTDEIETFPCTVNGYEAYYWIFSDEAGSCLFLHWLDTDNGFACMLKTPAAFTLEQAITMAESMEPAD